MTVEITCFHTCDNRGTREYILNNSPFLSSSGKTEWLGKGYYFWTDSDYFAHEWGKIPPRNGSYVIVRSRLTIQDEDFLDLVGNVKHQLYFNTLVDHYREYLEKIIKTSDNLIETQKLEKVLKNLAVSTVINHYKKQKIFDYKVVKAQDIARKSANKLCFVPRRNESLFTPTRQQLVVYEEAKSCIGSVEWHYSK